MVYGNDEFNVCPAGKEADSFHERILAGLVDSFSEYVERYQEISNMPPKQRNPDELEFFSLYEKAQNSLEQLQNSTASYDQKYALAQKIREFINDLELI